MDYILPNIKKLKDTIQDCNINILIGSGMSLPYLSTLGKIEQLLTELSSKEKIDEYQKQIIRASLYKKYFDNVISKNIEVLENHQDSTEVLEYYKSFLKALNSILLERKNTILNKQINIFTTNIDIYLEKALENTNVEYNDGFKGHFNPIFDLSNFKKSYFKTSLQYDNIYELPVFNLMKVHGSLTWEKEVNSDNILFSSNLGVVRGIKKKLVRENNLIEFDIDIEIDDLIKKVARKKSKDLISRKAVKKFLTEYEKLLIVNPTKEKFGDTVLNQTYYDLLRIYSNELEKENTVLFVMGFSFADEHIRKVTIRSANSNPTLVIYYFAYESGLQEYLEKENIINNNIKIITPPIKKIEDGKIAYEYQFNLFNINKEVFLKILGENKEKENI